ncbi:RNA-binding protein [Paenibacillus sp. HJGM_3]|uniref:RNA-binding protein n=1 Tax=Paenibacillus sp. HJGM_3 TaxID=3379816 RepID=UPI00385CD4F0
MLEVDVAEGPDFKFVTYCFEQYGLNRGIYNTIDEWLYEYGYQHIVERRRTILAFLQSLQDGHPRHTFLKFGKGGLTKQLFDFISDRGLQVSRMH